MDVCKNYGEKIHIDKEKTDKEVLQKFMCNFGCARKIYNLYVECLYQQLEDMKYEKGNIAMKDIFIPKITFFKNNPDYPYLKDADSLGLCNAKLEFEAALKKFIQDFDHKTYRKGAVKSAKAGNIILTFRHLKGIPRFKSRRKGHYAYKTNRQVTNGYESIKLIGNELYLPKIKKPIILHMHRPLPEDVTIKNVTITKAINGEFYASVNYERIIHIDDTIRNMVIGKDKEGLSKLKYLALDYSQQDFFVDNNGLIPKNLHYYRKSEEKLARLQRQLSHMVYDSNNYKKKQAEIARLHTRIANQRKDALHKLSTAIVNEYDVVIVEDIDLRGMGSALSLGKNLHDNGFGMFRTFLAYKLEKKGSCLVKTDRWLPSSQLCHTCGYKYSDLSMSERDWECPVCHTHHDRDINAALNLLKEGMHIFPEYFFWVIMNPKVKSNPLGKKYHKKSSRKAA